MMSGRSKHPKYARNKNVIVIGGSGSGKTRFFVKPNLMQMPEKVSYVCTDPKGYNYRGQSKDAFTKSEKYRIFVTYRIPTKNKRR